ncbi:zinc transporter ZIP1, putative [Plasmodium vinckei brucechwatti]|uniref:Zinc transporter ZIP1, putative n=1 Tax=Plasmodium vinckei brucechwatti TaxID=119398 RepID=A0A6V7RSM9_PLAVN|nr:zinc transporter ZIP1, putative [Plasmodium vinckei brucechwatti]
MDLLLAKAICIFAFLSVATGGCAIPYILGLFGKRNRNKYESKVKNILSNLNCFGAGFIFSIVMFHLLPETITIASSHKDITIFKSHDPEMKTLFIFFFVFLGFSMQLALEYVLPTDTSLCCVDHGAVKFTDGNDHILNVENHTSENPNTEIHNMNMNTDAYYHTHEGNHSSHKNRLTKFLDILALQSFFLTISLAIHSGIEGMIVGTSDDSHFVFITTFCILSHKWIAGVTVSLSLNRNHISKNLKIILLLIFIFSSPLGIILGHLVHSSGEKITCLINAISIGTLLFIGCEILLNEMQMRYPRKVRFSKWLSFCSSCLIAFSIIYGTSHIAPHHRAH